MTPLSARREPSNKTFAPSAGWTSCDAPSGAVDPASPLSGIQEPAPLPCSTGVKRKRKQKRKGQVPKMKEEEPKDAPPVAKATSKSDRFKQKKRRNRHLKRVNNR